MSNYEALLTIASQLPIVDRLQLIEDLWNTVPPESLPPVSDEWREEIKRRQAEYDSGRSKSTPWEQVRAEAHARLGLEAPDASH